MMLTSIADQMPTFLAYLDPGTGSLMLQVVIAALFSGLFFLRTSFAMIRSSLIRFLK
jgi:hypothetical protein